MYIHRHNSVYKIETRLQSVQPKRFMGRPDHSRFSSCSPHTMHSAPRKRHWEACSAPSHLRVLLILLPCSLCYLLPFLPSKDFQVHLNVIFSLGLSPFMAEPLFPLRDFHIPLCKHHFSSFALILNHSCFCKDLSFLLHVRHVWAGATSYCWTLSA